MNSFFELLNNIKKRPVLYLSEYSIFSFQSFVHGYLMAKEMFTIPKTEEEQEFGLFLEWIQDVYSSGIVNRSWAIIMFVYSADERDALNRFFDLFERYLEDKKSESEDNENE